VDKGLTTTTSPSEFELLVNENIGSGISFSAFRVVVEATVGLGESSRLDLRWAWAG